jgi:hypothetical protein
MAPVGPPFKCHVKEIYIAARWHWRIGEVWPNLGQGFAKIAQAAPYWQEKS